MRKCVIVLTTLFALAVDSPRPAEAGAFATEFTQLLNHAQLVLQYIQQGQQLAIELAMYADMLHNSRTLGSQTFGSVGADITALASDCPRWPGAGVFPRQSRPDFPDDIPRISDRSEYLLPTIPRLEPDVVGHNAGSAPRCRAARPAAPKRAGHREFTAGHGTEIRRANGGFAGPGRHQRSTSPATDESPRDHAGGHVEQTSISGDRNPAGSGKPSRHGVVLHHW